VDEIVACLSSKLAIRAEDQTFEKIFFSTRATISGTPKNTLEEKEFSIQVSDRVAASANYSFFTINHTIEIALCFGMHRPKLLVHIPVSVAPANPINK
jgi:hypothetical protein